LVVRSWGLESPTVIVILLASSSACIRWSSLQGRCRWRKSSLQGRSLQRDRWKWSGWGLATESCRSGVVN
jgi:hypothetical protein